MVVQVTLCSQAGVMQMRHQKKSYGCGGGTDYVAPEPTVCSEDGACVGEEGECVFADAGFDCDGNAQSQ